MRTDRLSASVGEVLPQQQSQLCGHRHVCSRRRAGLMASPRSLRVKHKHRGGGVKGELILKLLITHTLIRSASVSLKHTVRRNSTQTALRSRILTFNHSGGLRRLRLTCTSTVCFLKPQLEQSEIYIAFIFFCCF